MAYISGNTSESGRLIIINEDTWSIEENRTISSGDYLVNGLEDGKKTVICRKDDGELEVKGNIDTAIENYQVFSCGLNNRGQLGLGNTTSISTPITVGDDSDWISVSCGYDHTLVMKTDGTLWGCGHNNYGQLGLNNVEPRSTLTKVGTDTDWKYAGGGDRFTLALKTDGTLWACGYNSIGQLGLGDTVNRSTLIQIGSATDWKSVSGGGSSHTLTLKTDGTMWSCGSNWAGQLGLGNTVSRSTLTQIGTDTDWKSVVCCISHTLALKTNGTLWGCGLNTDGQLGLNDRVNRSTLIQIGSATNWKDVSGGGSIHTLTLKTDGTMWSCGSNWAGQLGLGNTVSRSTLTQIGTATNWGFIGCGGHHTLAVKTDGTLWSCGYNVYGQLGLDGGGNRSTLIQIGTDSSWSSVVCGSSHTLALK